MPAAAHPLVAVAKDPEAVPPVWAGLCSNSNSNSNSNSPKDPVRHILSTRMPQRSNTWRKDCSSCWMILTPVVSEHLVSRSMRTIWKRKHFLFYHCFSEVFPLLLFSLRNSFSWAMKGKMNDANLYFWMYSAFWCHRSKHIACRKSSLHSLFRNCKALCKKYIARFAILFFL